MIYNQKLPNELLQLKADIAAARMDLNTVWIAQGCTDDIVLAASSKLDKLCNRYQRLIKE